MRLKKKEICIRKSIENVGKFLVVAIKTCSRTLLPLDIPVNMLILLKRVTCQMDGWSSGSSFRKEKSTWMFHGPLPDEERQTNTENKNQQGGKKVNARARHVSCTRLWQTPWSRSRVGWHLQGRGRAQNWHLTRAVQLPSASSSSSGNGGGNRGGWSGARAKFYPCTPPTRYSSSISYHQFPNSVSLDHAFPLLLDYVQTCFVLTPASRQRFAQERMSRGETKGEPADNYRPDSWAPCGFPKGRHHPVERIIL